MSLRTSLLQLTKGNFHAFEKGWKPQLVYTLLRNYVYFIRLLLNLSEAKNH